MPIGSHHFGTVPTGAVVAVDVEGRKTASPTASRLFAFDDACTHRHCSLAKGRLSGKTATCECDGSQFDVTTGRVLRGPAVQPVHTYRVRLQDGRVEIEV